MESKILKIHVELSGGLELLFSKQKEINLEMANSSTVRDLIEELKSKHIKENPDLFYIDSGL